MSNVPDAQAKLSIITTCKGRLGHLKKTLPAMTRQPDVEIIVVDYDCPEHAADWVEQQYPSVRTVRVENRDRFNISHARNLGAAVASGDWLCFMDADVEPAEDFSRQVAQRLEPFRFYTATPFVKEIYGTCILPRKAYLKAGGYDEVIEPWSYEDKDMYLRLLAMGLAERHFPATLLTPIQHDDAARMRFAGHASRWETMRRNAFYVHSKLLAMRALGAPLDLDNRSQLYAQIKQAIADNPERSEITLRLPSTPSGKVAPGWALDTRLVVVLRREQTSG